MKYHAQIFKALSDPIRLRIILLLQSEGELCVCDLMAVLKLPQSTVSRHLAYLRKTCWVDTRREGVWMFYQLGKESCQMCSELLDTLKKNVSMLPDSLSDRKALAEFIKSKSHSCL
jgi:ArsR family transcriptional regulator